MSYWIMPSVAEAPVDHPWPQRLVQIEFLNTPWDFAQPCGERGDESVCRPGSPGTPSKTAPPAGERSQTKIAYHPDRDLPDPNS
jgi:hypothetical protein